MPEAWEREAFMDKKVPEGNRASLEGCPLATAFVAIGGKWKLTILYWLAHGELHFAGLKRRASRVSSKVLAEQLRELEADGIVSRTPTGASPAPVIYRLTSYGETLLPIIESVRLWGEGHMQRSAATRHSGDRACSLAIGRQFAGHAAD
jgi:DNA-binding HxlR family transcriptional regulator